jgi:predicted amidohydrolase
MTSRPQTESDVVEGRRLKIAAVQMDANLAPTIDRLARAERLVTATVESGAQLTVLPELFNTGYSYSNENHTRVEPLDGPTARWMRDTVVRLGVHLAGSLMLFDHGEVYNALLLFAPDGRMWRYDKVYPWAWERASFRGSHRRHGATVAETDLGDIGLLLCWDAAHLDLWARYAGRVDMVVICSSPPDVGDSCYHFPGGDQVRFDELGPMVASNREGSVRLFGDMINQQAAWLGVPVVNTVGCGHISTRIPRGRLAILGYVFSAPRLLRYLRQANRVEMSCDMVHRCKVVDGRGEVLAQLTKEDGEAHTLAEVSLAATKPRPRDPQPASLLPRSAYFLSDVLLPTISTSVYRKARRRWRAV